MFVAGRFPWCFSSLKLSPSHCVRLAVLDASILDQETIVDPDNSSGLSWKYELSRGFCDKKVVTAVNAQLHSMETYINPNVESALGIKGHNPDLFDQNETAADSCQVYDDNSDDQLLGVALIQPVTAGIEFCQIRRDRFPTLESFSVSMEPVSTMLSFEDLTLLEAILERWSPRAMKVNSLSIDGSSSHLDAARMSMVVASQSSFESEGVVDRDLQTVSYDVTFERDRLGLVLKKVSGAIVVENMQNREEAEVVQVGDTLTAINGVAVESPSLDEVVEILSTSPRPVRISFSRKVSTQPSAGLDSLSFGISQSFSRSREEPASDDSVDAVANEGFADDKCLPDVYTITLRRGALNGLTVEPSPCGGLPVVIDVLPSFFLNAISIVDGASGSFEVNETLTARLPRTGAVVAEIDGKPSSEIGYLETKELLDKLSSKMTEVDKLSLAVDSDATFSVKFFELDASEWGKIKTAELGVAGIALTFIDDFKGRDMPLLRGKLDCIDIHIERGLGIEPRAVVVSPPDVLDLSENGADSRDEITMIRSIIQIEIDYYHPRVAVWEPLLEPSNLCFVVEWQRGSVHRPGQVAVEVSDSVFGGGEAQPSAQPRIVSLNLTDAAAEVVVRSIKEWKDWRQRAFDRQEADVQHLGTVKDEEVSSPSNEISRSVFPFSPTAQSDFTTASFSKMSGRFGIGPSLQPRHAAAQKAAKAALVFAQKRGAGTKEKSESSKPFVFRNRTGVSLSFMQQGPTQDKNVPASTEAEYEEQCSRPFSPIRGLNPTFLADGSDARFHMDVLSHDQRQKDDFHNTKRVRAYDGQFPSLCVNFEAVPGIVIKPLRNLPVFKVGNTISRLEVRKHHSEADAELSCRKAVDQMGSAEYSVPVVWTVEIEDNRRILTLSSAVRVISSGVSLSVDVGVRTSVRSEDSVSTTSSASEVAIKEVGTAQSGSPFYLPLRLALRSEFVDVFVKPSGLDYSWSKKSILSFVPVESFDGDSSSGHSLTEWVWKETFDSSCSVSCNPPPDDMSGSRTLWLSCISLPHVGGEVQRKEAKRARTSRSVKETKGALISIAVDAGLTVRNMLPVNLQWEVVTFEGSDMLPLDSSSSQKQHDSVSHTLKRSEYGLLSGEGVEVLSFSLGLRDARARFRCYCDQEWSEWAQLALSSQMKPSHQQMDGSDESENHGGKTNIAA